MIASNKLRSPAAARLAGLCVVFLAGCTAGPTLRETPAISPTIARAAIVQLLPPKLADRSGWAVDIYAGFAAMEIPPTPENICAVIAITEQESGFKVDPPVPGLAAIAWREIDTRAADVGIPKRVLRAALRAKSPDGRTYAERIDAAKTERELSEIFEDLIAAVPLGKTFLADRNPVRTGGPMQVSIAFAEEHADDHPYPYPVESALRREVFARRGGMFFGIAHLLDYPASYDRPLYRFADFNAGHYASRNAAFQNALSLASGIPLELDGDLIRIAGDAADSPGSTELAARVLAKRFKMRDSAIREDLELGRKADFENTRLYKKVFSLADQLESRPVPRAVMPQIKLKSPKITRRLTTAWFAGRVEERYQRCLLRSSSAKRAAQVNR